MSDWTAIETGILAALDDVRPLVAQAFAELEGPPGPDDARCQAGLLDGHETVREFVEHGDYGLALEHLVYMIDELDLRIRRSTLARIKMAGETMRMDPALWRDLHIEIQ